MINEKDINRKLSKMNYTLEDFIQVQKELLAYDIKPLEEDISGIEKTVYTKYEEDEKKISFLNHELILINEQIDNMLYVESVKKLKSMNFINQHLKAIKMIDKKNRLNRIYESLINKQRDKKIIELKKEIDMGYKEHKKSIKINMVIILSIYSIFGIIYFLKLLNI